MDTVSKVKIKLTQWKENLQAQHICDKELVSKIHKKEHLQLTNKKTTWLKKTKNLNRHFCNGDL